MDYSKIFNIYETEGYQPFYLLNKKVSFPEDKSSPVFSKRYVNSDTPWTIMSYLIYGVIDYWWILCGLNDSSIFYAKENTEIYYIKKEYLNIILQEINAN